MSLAAALKKGLEAADTIGNWDPFAEESATPAAAASPKTSAPANANGRAVARAAAPKAALRKPAAEASGGKPAARNPIAAVREKAAQASGKAQQPARTRAPQKPAGTDPRAPEAKGQRANWLHDAVSGGRVNTAQYVRELDRYAAEEARRAVADVVMTVNQAEVEGVVRHAARIKGRYLAKLLDIGAKAKAGVMEAEVTELTRHREAYEELARGLELLKSAIEAGDVTVSGTVRR
jgi:pyruvate/2-oxoglutarate dehydrogenase complex dihydrolipoamide acyltransferase (E2) component